MPRESNLLSRAEAGLGGNHHKQRRRRRGEASRRGSFCLWRLTLLALFLILARRGIVVIAADEGATGDFQRGFAAIQRGAFTEAESELKAGLKTDPKSPRGWDLLGIAEDGLGRFAEAEKAYRRALGLDPKFVRARNDLGISLYRRGLRRAATQAFIQALALDPQNFTANYNLGIIAQSSKRYREALKYLAAARAQAPSDAPVLLALTTAYLGTGEVEPASSAARDLVALGPTNPQIRFSLGALFLEWKQYAAAADHLAQARLAEPDNFEVLYDLGQAYKHLGKYSEAEEAFLHCLSVRSDSVDALYQLAVVYAQSSHHDQAIQALVEARQLAPKRPDVLLLLGRELIHEGFVADAIQVLQDCAGLDPDKIEPHLLLGEALTRDKQFETALKEYQKVEQLDPANPQSYVLLGRTMRYMGRCPESESALLKALKLDPPNAQANFYLGLNASDTGDYARARRYFERSLKSEPKYMPALYELGVVWMKQADPARARDYLERARSLSPTFPEVHYRLAAVYRELKDSVRAAQAIELFKKYNQVDVDRQREYPGGLLEFVQETQKLPEKERLERYRQALLKSRDRKPDDPSVLFMLARIDLGLGDRLDALQSLTKLASLPSSAGVRMRSASLLATFNDYPEAVRELTTLLEGQPKDDEARFALASLYYQMYRTDEASSVLGPIGSGFRSSAAYHDLRGRILDRQGNSAEALQELKSAVNLDTRNDDDVLDLVTRLAFAGKSAEAESVLTQAERNSPASVKLLFAQGICLEVEKRLSEAERAFRRASDLSWRWEAPYLAQGNLFRHTGALAQATESLDQTASQFPDSPWPHWFKALALLRVGNSRGEQAVSEIDLAMKLAPHEPGVYAALLSNALSRRDCAAAAEVWTATARLGLAGELDPAQWCGAPDRPVQVSVLLPAKVLAPYSDLNLLVDLARRTSGLPETSEVMQ